jgi:hypothetical protein
VFACVRRHRDRDDVEGPRWCVAAGHRGASVEVVADTAIDRFSFVSNRPDPLVGHLPKGRRVQGLAGLRDTGPMARSVS